MRRILLHLSNRRRNKRICTSYLISDKNIELFYIWMVSKNVHSTQITSMMREMGKWQRQEYMANKTAKRS